MEHWKFNKIRLSENFYRRDVENLNAYEYRYCSLLLNNENYIIRLYITGKYTKFSFTLQNIGCEDENVELHEPKLGHLIPISESEFPTQQLRLGFALKYLKGIFPSFEFDDNIEL